MFLKCRSLSTAQRFLESAYKGWEGVAPEVNTFIKKENIVGEIPSSLQGTFLRNGPGLIEKYGHKLSHPIDGDGMVCALTFPGDGTIHFKNKFVQTEEYLKEENAREFLFRGQMGSITEEQKETDGILVKYAVRNGTFPKIHFRNPSNTNVWHWGDRFISAYETGLPYSLDPATLDTKGKETFDSTLRLKRLGAHFRIDTSDPNNFKLVTGAFIRSPMKPDGALEINEYNWDMSLAQSTIYDIEGLTYFHDLAIIDGYYVVHKSPFVTMNPAEAIQILSGQTGPEYNMKYNNNLPSQFVFLPKDGKGEQIVVDTPFPFHMYHFGTCYRERDNVVLSTTSLAGAFDMSWEWRYWLSNMCKAPGKFNRFDIDLKSMTVKSHAELDPSSNEFPTSHPFRHGQVGTRYNYLMACDEPNRGLPFVDIVKVDMEKGASARKVWRADGLISECVFAPRAGYESATSNDEDDGWLITQYFNPDVPDETQFLVLDAKNVEDGPVCRIKLDFKINYPFHGTFTPDVFLK